MHETLKRRICRVGFVAACLAPAVGMTAATGARHGSAARRALESKLTAELGLAASIERLEYTRPGSVLVHELRLADADSAATVFTCRLVEAQDVGGRLVLRVHDAQIQAAYADRLWELFDERLRRKPPGDRRVIDIVPCRCTWQSARGAQTYEDVALRFEAGADQAWCEIEFRPAGDEVRRPARFAAARTRGANPATLIEFDTRGERLPTSILAAVADLPSWLGPTSTVTGSLTATQGETGWSASLRDFRLSQVDLYSLVSAHFPHRLEGTADVFVSAARIELGRLVEGEGELRAGPGVISRSLVDSGAEFLGWRVERQVDELPQTLSYGELAFAFAVGGAGDDSPRLSLQGRCRRRGTLLADGLDRPLVLEPETASPVAALVRTLVPHSRFQVPATRETEWLASRLPIPRLQPDSKRSASEVRLRLSGQPKPLE
jgi:hypothetical protein